MWIKASFQFCVEAAAMVAMMATSRRQRCKIVLLYSIQSGSRQRKHHKGSERERENETSKVNKKERKKELQTDDNDNARTDLKLCNLKITHPHDIEQRHTHIHISVMHFARISHCNIKSWMENWICFIRKYWAFPFFTRPRASKERDSLTIELSWLSSCTMTIKWHM